MVSPSTSTRMAILGTLLKKGIKLRKSIEQEKKSPFLLQKNELLKLLTTARDTAFGKTYHFDSLIENIQKNSKLDRSFYEQFKAKVPTHNYNKIYNQWWYRAKEGERDVCWKGKIKYFALSSGTSEASSKYIPITKEMIKAIRRTSIRQILSLANYPDLPPKLFEGGILMLGGSTHLNYNGMYFSGDLSGITASKLPFWFQHFYKPGKKIAKNSDWNAKLDEIVQKAPKWNICIVAGVPAWIQILFEKIIAHYKVKNIHEIWPNLTIYVHGGVAFEPYRNSFSKLLGKELLYLETYLASEGFIAYQARPDGELQLVLNNGIFLEFVPFNDNNFDANGEMIDNPEAFLIDEIEEGKEYALLLSTCAGAWRYLIGDTVKLVNRQYSDIVITGRTKHFLSLCGEHLSVDNMNKAIESVSKDMGFLVKEFTVAGIKYDTLFAHKWYIGVDEPINTEELKSRLDAKLCELNDDYKVERTAALKEIIVHTIPTHLFYDWMRSKGKEGGQTKFPRVVKGDTLKDWEDFLAQKLSVSLQ